KSTDAVQRFPAHRNRGAETGLRDAEAQRNDHLGKKMGIDGDCREPRPEARSGDAVIKAGYRSDIWSFEFADYFGQIVRADLNGAVRNDQDLVAGERSHIDEVRDLAIGPVLARIACAGEQLVRKCGLQPLDHLHRRIISVMRTENDLDRTCVILIAERSELREQPRLRAVQWL